jgi:hypothetical protein
MSSTAVALLPGPLTYAGNRTLLATRTKPAGTFRVAVLGDSMGYGAGVPYRKAFAPRLAAHLNSALPDWWVECVSFGVSGACIHHAAGRAITHALPAAADLVVIAVCCNDAFLLGPQPSDLTVLGAQWVDLRPLVSRSLAAFHDAVTAAGHRTMVVYLDKLVQAGEVCVPASLGGVCEELGVPFVDGSSVLTGYQQSDLMVSTADGHLSGLAYDVIARHVTQAISGGGLLPASSGFDDAHWIEGVEDGAHARVRGGLAAPLAFAEALRILDGKWLARRNTRRKQLEPQYAATRERLVEEQRASLSRIAYGSMQERVRVKQPIVALWRVEMWANALMAMTFGLAHALEVGEADGVMANLRHLEEDDQPQPTVSASIARWEAIQAGVERMQRTLDQASMVDGTARVASELDYLAMWTSRVSQWGYVVDQCARRYLELLPRAVPPLDRGTAMALTYVDRRAAVLQDHLAELTTTAEEIAATGRNAARAGGATHLSLELILSGAPGAESWSFTVGMESTTPAFSERHVGTGYVIRDGQPHVYEFDLPVTLSGHVHIYAEGDGMRVQGGGLRVHKAVLKWPLEDLQPVTLPPPMLEASSDISVSLVFRVASTLPRVATLGALSSL